MTGVGIVVAMRWEADGVKRLAAQYLLSGTGPGRAETAARQLAAGGATSLMSWGVAAGLDPNLRPGTLLVPEQVLAEDGTSHAVDGAWRSGVMQRLGALEPWPAALAETTSILEGADAKAALWNRTGAAAADMESAAVLRVAGEAGLPGLVIRAVLDPATASVPAAWAHAVDAVGRVRPGGLAAVLARPRRWRAGLELARYRRSARRSLWAAAAALSATE